VATLAQRREQLASPQLTVLVRFVDFEVGGGGVVEVSMPAEISPKAPIENSPLRYGDQPLW
jgi:hypothetical protein